MQYHGCCTDHVTDVSCTNQISLLTSPQDLLTHGRYTLTTEEKKSGNTPMHVVGSFLAALFQNFELSTYTLKHRRPSSLLSHSPSSQSAHILHSCQGFTQSQLLRLIISIYGGVPEVFEVFHCRHNTTEEELRLFLNPKRATKRPFQYLILEVNRLPYQLQEVCVQDKHHLSVIVCQSICPNGLLLLPFV